MKTITSLIRHSTQKNVFITASLDNTIRVWCIEVRASKGL